MIHPTELKRRLEATAAIFSSETATLDKLRSIKPLFSGINPKVDVLLETYDARLKQTGMVLEGDVVTLGAEALPEDTEDRKKRKAAILLLIKSWKELESEIERVSAELEAGKGKSSASTFTKIFSASKGPLAFITILAVAAALLHTTSVAIEIRNEGCGTLEPRVSLPFPIPGFSLPEEAIAPGGSGIASIPPIPLAVNGDDPAALVLSALGFSLTFWVGNADDITFNGVSLIGKTTNLELSGGPHVLVVKCE